VARGPQGPGGRPDTDPEREAIRGAGVDEAIRTGRRGQLAGVAFLLAAIVVAVVVGSGALSGEDPAKDASVVGGVKGTRETTALLRGIPQDGIVLGRPDAPATVVEFVDVKCPVCQGFVLKDGPRIVKDLVRTGRANLELRVIALPRFRPNTLLGRTAVHALVARDRAWALTELLFYNQGPETTQWVQPTLLARIARVAPELRGVPTTTTPTAATRRLDAEADALASRLGVTGTPSIYVRPRGRTDTGAYRHVSLKGTGSDAGKVAAAVADLGG
jgi:protein-disulfide isomerase